MKVVGINLGMTKDGMTLNDGGACLIDDKGIIAVAEERVTRSKYAGGFCNALQYCLDSRSYHLNEIDQFVVSSCCETPRQTLKDIQHILPLDKTVVIPSHHLSHAYSTYFSSPFDHAIIMVIDNEGNVVEDYGKKDFFDNGLERASYYIGQNNNIAMLHRDTISNEFAGIGEVYRYFTHYIGFPSYVYAGKTMGLAPYGNPNTFKNIQLFEINNGKIISRIKSNYQNCNKALEDFFQENYNICLPGPRCPIDEIQPIYADLAYLVQNELEQILIQKTQYLIHETGIENICLAGGVALNSVVNYKIKKHTMAKNVYVVPAAGDTGQCLGNALYAYHHIGGHTHRHDLNNAYLGKSYKIDINKIFEVHSEWVEKLYVEEFSCTEALNKKAALLLYEGNIIGRFSGRSEFGPRALGNRSILMDCRNAQNKEILNQRIKFRESFRPFAPIVLSEYAKEYFDIDFESPYMLFVAQVKRKEDIPAVTHVDNSARVQTLQKESNEGLYDLINQYYQLSNVPVVLNTSFNISDEPIVETPEDAISCFLRTNLDVLILENYLLYKR